MSALVVLSKVCEFFLNIYWGLILQQEREIRKCNNHLYIPKMSFVERLVKVQNNI